MDVLPLVLRRLWRWRGCGGLFGGGLRNQRSAGTGWDNIVAGDAPLAIFVLLDGYDLGRCTPGKDAVIFDDDPLIFFGIFGKVKLGVQLLKGSSLKIAEGVADRFPDALPGGPVDSALEDEVCLVPIVEIVMGVEEIQP